MKHDLYSLLKECQVEKDVEEKFKKIIGTYFPESTISSPYGTDGLLQDPITNLKMLMEFKYNRDLTNRIYLVEILIQLIYYLKKFENHGDELPTVILGGDKNKCFCMHSNDVIKYLDESVDWSVAPSDAFSKNPGMVDKIFRDKNIIPFVFNITENFNFNNIIIKINQLHTNTLQKFRITVSNINRHFSYFEEYVIKNSKKYSSEDLISIFIGFLTDPINNYPHPRKDNCHITKAFGEISVNMGVYNSFFNHFETNYRTTEKMNLTAICDRLIDDKSRRANGEYYTPTEWVIEAHDLIEKHLGCDWKDKFSVWDPAWGTGNLTRDYHFKELFTSTLNWGDIIIGENYNQEAIAKFQYDFLNDDVIDMNIISVDNVKKIPGGLFKVIDEGKPIVIFMNPPYFESSVDNSHAAIGNKKSKVADIMTKYKMGKISKQLYACFLYRIINFNSNNLYICSFTPTNTISLASYSQLRNMLFEKVSFVDGFIFNLKEFSDTKGDNPILFSIWKPGVETNNEFIVDIKSKQNNIISTTGSKKLYTTDEDHLAKKWASPKVGDMIESPYCLSNGVNIQIKKHKMLTNSIGWFEPTRNIHNSRNVNIFSVPFSTPRGYSITEENFYRCISTFTAQVLTNATWFNKSDEFIIPNINHPDYNQWNIDSIVCSLFNNSSQQTSLRKINNTNNRIINEFFWMANEQMQILANGEVGFDGLYHDASNDHDRFMYNKIQEIYANPNKEFSPDAEYILNASRELVVESFKYREKLHNLFPEYHLNAWDAGWFQIKKILSHSMVKEFREFTSIYKDFEKRMSQGIYKFGFLK